MASSKACFLCRNVKSSITVEPFSETFKHLEKDLGKLLTSKGLSRNGSSQQHQGRVERSQKQNFEVGICEGCRQACERYSAVYQKLEKTLEELTLCIEDIHKKVEVKNGTWINDAERGGFSGSQTQGKNKSRSLLLKTVANNLRLLKSGHSNVSDAVMESTEEPESPAPCSISEENSNPPDLPNLGSPSSVEIFEDEEEMEIDLDQITPRISVSSSATKPVHQSVKTTVRNPKKSKSDPEVVEISSSEDEVEAVSESDDGEDPLPVEDPLKDVRHQVKLNLETKLWSCPISNCNKEYTKKGGVFSHLLSAHFNLSRSTRYQCDVCNCRKFDSGVKLDLHRKHCLALKEYAMKNKNNPLICRICWLQSSSVGNHNYHMRRIHSKTPMLYSCDMCDSKYKSKEGLEIHKDATHLGIVYRCLPPCEATFKYKARLRKHIVTCNIYMKAKEDKNSPISSYFNT